MTDDFDKSFKFSIWDSEKKTGWEGGPKWTKTPGDAGGETQWGISKAAHPEVVFPMSELEAREFYHREYWLKYKIDKEKMPWSMIFFDTAVNLGYDDVERIWKLCQKDPLTFCALRAFKHAKRAIIVAGQEKFGKGWLRRVIDLYHAAMSASNA